MGFNSKIEWTDHTANLWHGCTKVHAGCDNCYAETQSKRWGRDIWGNDMPRLWIQSFLDDLHKFQKDAAKNKEVKRVFVGSMMDIFEKPMPLIDSKGKPLTVLTDTGKLRDMFFTAISNNAYPNLYFLLLTKRPSNINKMIPESWKNDPPENVMFGTSVSDQKTFDTLVPQLIKVNGRRFLSIEPQLDEISLVCSNNKIQADKTYNARPMDDVYEDSWFVNHFWEIDWIIQGGESGQHKRPFNLSWAYRMKRECTSGMGPTLSIAYFFKQIDKVTPIPEDLMIRETPDCFYQYCQKIIGS